MNEKELRSILVDADCEALSEGIKKGKDFVIPVKEKATIHFVFFSAPFVRLDFVKVTEDDILTQRAILELTALDELVGYLRKIKAIKEGENNVE